MHLHRLWTKLTFTKLKNSLLRKRRRQMLCLKKIFWQLFLYPAACGLRYMMVLWWNLPRLQPKCSQNLYGNL